MSVDPYHEVQSEIQSSLQTAEQLRATFMRIRSTAHDGNEELEWARNEVRTKCVHGGDASSKNGSSPPRFNR